MRMVIGIGVGLLALGGFAWTSFADISAVNADRGTVGDTITVTGTGFGSKKPKVKFEFVGPLPTAKAKSPKLKGKVVAFSDTEVQILLTKANVGEFNLTIQPKGGDAQLREDAFLVLPPNPDSVNVESATRKGRFTITGTNFGSKKGKISLVPTVPFAKGGNSSAKVKSWTNTEIEVEVGKKVADGDYDVEVQGKAGSSRLLSGVRIFGDAPKPLSGKDTVTGNFGGTSLKANKASIIANRLPSSPGILGEGISVPGGSVKVNGPALNLSILTRFPQNLADLTLPAQVTSETDATMFVTFGKVTTSGNFPNIQINTQGYTNGPGFAVTLTNVSGNRIAGTFSGTMNRSMGDGPATIQVTNGKFTATFNN